MRTLYLFVVLGVITGNDARFLAVGISNPICTECNIVSLPIMTTKIVSGSIKGARLKVVSLPVMT